MRSISVIGQCQWTGQLLFYVESDGFEEDRLRDVLMYYVIGGSF